MLNMLDIISTFSIHSNQSRSTRNRNNGQLSKGSTARQSTRPNYKFKKLQIEDEKVSPRSKDKVDVSVITEKQRHMENENESSFPSLVFPLLIFQRISYRKLLKEIKFEKGIKSLHPEDNRNIVLYRIMCELFSELNFEIQNILICQHPITKIFFMYFSDTEICPTSKCCNNNIVVKIGQVIGGQIMCLSPKCPVSILTTFEIEEKVLWQTRQQHSTVSNYVTNGKYRTKSLLQSIPSLDGNKSTNNKKSQCYNTTKQWKRSTTFHNKGSLTNCEQLYKYELSKDILMNSQVFNKDFDIQIDEKLRSKYNFQF